MEQSYPVEVRARLDEPLSRWLWLVKWLLAIPHFIVLFFLWIAFAVITVIAFFAIVFTGRTRVGRLGPDSGRTGQPKDPVAAPAQDVIISAACPERQPVQTPGQ
jgi:hypothetical protein